MATPPKGTFCDICGATGFEPREEGCSFCNGEGLDETTIQIQPIPPGPYIEPDYDGTESYEEFMAKLKVKAEAVKADIEAGRYRHGQLRPEISAEKREIAHLDWSMDPSTLDHIRDMMRELYIKPLILDRPPFFHEMYGRDGMKFDDLMKSEPQTIPMEPSVTGRWTTYKPMMREITRHSYIMDEAFDWEITPDIQKRLYRKFFHDSYGPTPLGATGPEKPEPDWKRKTFVSGPETKPNAAKRAKLRAKRKKK